MMQTKERGYTPKTVYFCNYCRHESYNEKQAQYHRKTHAD